MLMADVTNGRKNHRQHIDRPWRTDRCRRASLSPHYKIQMARVHRAARANSPVRASAGIDRAVFIAAFETGSERPSRASPS